MVLVEQYVRDARMAGPEFPGNGAISSVTAIESIGPAGAVKKETVLLQIGLGDLLFLVTWIALLSSTGSTSRA